MGLNVFAAEVLRFLSICSHADFAFVKTRKMAKVLIERGYIVKLIYVRASPTCFASISISCLSSMFSR